MYPWMGPPVPWAHGTNKWAPHETHGTYGPMGPIHPSSIPWARRVGGRPHTYLCVWGSPLHRNPFSGIWVEVAQNLNLVASIKTLYLVCVVFAQVIKWPQPYIYKYIYICVSVQQMLIQRHHTHVCGNLNELHVA